MKCDKCPELIKSRTSIVKGRGAVYPDCDIMFVGEAPGQVEDEKRKAFCGKAGSVLASLAEQAGINPHKVYLANACRCRPPGNRTPRMEEIANCHPNLIEEIKEVRPKVIVSLGRPALASLWRAVPIGDVAGQTLVQEETGIPLIPTYHPAYVMRRWQAAPIVLAHFRKAARIAAEGVGPQELGDYYPVLTVESLRELRDYLLSNAVDRIGFDTETTGLSWMMDELLCISLSDQAGVGYVIPILQQHLMPAWGEEEWPEVIELIGDILASNKPKAAQHASFDLRFLERRADWDCVEATTAFGWKVNNLRWDTLLLSRAISQGSPHNLPALMAFWTDLPYYEAEVQALSARKRHMELVPDDVLWKYAGADADMVMRLLPLLEERVQELGMEWVIQKVATPNIRSCWEMEKRGVLVDQQLFAKVCQHYQEQIAISEKKLFEIAGGEIKYGDYRSLQRLLFKKLRLPIPNERTDSAAACDKCKKNRAHPCIDHVATGRETLERLNEEHPHPVLPIIINLKKLTKMDSTYLAGGVGGYARHIRPDGRIHPTFKVCFDDTGRHACEEPNLQNPPKNVEVVGLGLTDALRQCFVAPPGHVIMNADWSQLEVWVLAYQTQDPTLLELLRGGEDVHTHVARELGKLGISKKFPQVDPGLDNYEWRKAHEDLRGNAKPFVFGTSYGLTEQGAAVRLNCEVREASKLITAYKTQVFPTLPDYFAWVEQEMIGREVLVNHFGRRRMFEEIAVLMLLDYRRDLDERLRIGINFPIQSAGHDLHMAAHNAVEATPELLKRAKPVLEVHDSLVFEAVDKGQEYLVKTAWLIKELWEKLARGLILADGTRLGWEVPIEAEWGPSIGEKHWKLTAKGDVLDLRKEGKE